MKSGKCLLMLLMILFSPMAFAQQSGVNVTGSVVEQGSDTPIEQATVRLLNVKDSAMVRCGSGSLHTDLLQKFFCL